MKLTRVFCAAFFYLHVTREKLPKRLSYEKGTRKTLMKLTPDVINMHSFEHCCSLNSGYFIKAHITHDMFVHNFAIKRWKDIFHPKKCFLCDLKIFILDNHAYWNLVWKDFKTSLQYFDEKKNLLIKMSFYLFVAILCAIILCVKWSLLWFIQYL